MENSKIIAIVSISILLASVLFNPLQPVIADLEKINKLNKLKETAQEKAREYLKNIGMRSGYGQLNSTTTNGTAKNVKAELEKTMMASKEKAKQYLETIGSLKKNLAAKLSYGQLNYTSTNETGRDVKAEIEKAKKANEEKAMEILEKLFPKLFHKNYGS